MKCEMSQYMYLNDLVSTLGILCGPQNIPGNQAFGLPSFPELRTGKTIGLDTLINNGRHRVSIMVFLVPNLGNLALFKHILWHQQNLFGTF